MPNRSFGSRSRLSRNDQLELLGRLFHDDQLSLPVRIAGAPLLYAHPVTATVQLTINDVRVDTAPALRLGNNPYR